MKKTKQYLILAFVVFSLTVEAQRGKGHPHPKAKAAHRHPNKVVVVKRSPHRPAKVKVFHPHWHPGHAYHRRWVYFPGHNFYWDNWRNHYVFWNGVVWVSQPKAPPALVNINLETEKKKELKEEEDDVDDVYKLNEQHQKDKD